MENSLTPQEEIISLILNRAKELSMNGEHERAAELMIEHRRSQLADSHPSKNPGQYKELVGEQVSALAKFEQEVKKTQDAMAFITAITLGGKNPQSIGDTLSIFIDFFTEEHPALMSEVTRFLMKKKSEMGIEKGEWTTIIPISEEEIKKIGLSSSDK